MTTRQLSKKKSAIHLVNFIKGLGKINSAMDIGCGTGFVAIELLKNFPNLKLHLCDISQKMLTMAKHKLQDHKVIYTHCDAEIQEFTTTCDLAISNLCVQWFNDFEKFTKKILKTSKYFAFSTLVDGSFLEFSKIFESQGKASPFPKYRTEKELVHFCQSMGKMINMETKIFNLAFPSAKDAAMHFKKIGANFGKSSFDNALVLLSHRVPINLEYKIFFGLMERKIN
jgi:malonyl-CoA O-methyltransferase